MDLSSHEYHTPLNHHSYPFASCFCPIAKPNHATASVGTLEASPIKVSIGGTFVMLILYGRTGRNMHPKCKKPTPGKEMKNQSLVWVICQLIKLEDCFPKTKNKQPNFQSICFLRTKSVASTKIWPIGDANSVPAKARPTGLGLFTNFHAFKDRI